MGNILSGQEIPSKQTQNSNENNIKIAANWQVLQKKQHREILKSKRTSLIVERYSSELQNQEKFQQERKLFDWRNNNPNHQFMVNVLSVNKQEVLQSNKTFQCSAMGLCPSQKITHKVYAVTERILKLDQIADLITFQVQMENRKEKSILKIHQATKQIPHKKYKKKYQKIIPFANMIISESQAKRIIKDCIRGIQVLCYKFGYFVISYDHLGITAHKRGNVWISDNYSLNHLDFKNRIQVATAEQKFRYQRETIQKIMMYAESCPWFKPIIQQCKKHRTQKFDQFCAMIDRLGEEKINAFTSRNTPQTHQRNNTSLYVEHASFTSSSFSPNMNISYNNNSSFFQFDYRNALKRANSNQKINQILSSEITGQRNNKLINSGNNYPTNQNQNIQIKRSDTGEKVIIKISPESKQNIVFVNSNHKYCGKQTAPTNQLGHSSSLQSVQNINMQGCQEIPLKQQGKSLYKTHNNVVKFYPSGQNDLLQGEQNVKNNPSNTSNNKVYFPNHNYQNNKYLSTGEQYLFRSQNYESNDFNSPQNRQQKPKHKNRDKNYHNYSLDENNMIGPYRTDRIYSNMRKEKILLVDSMVMVHEQSQQIEEDAHNMSGANIVMQESIIIMGRDDPVLASSKSRKHNQSYY